jgi:hypothetical protein
VTPAGYSRLVELAEREAELIATSRFDELVRIDDERAELVERLPAMPPPAARPCLERAAALQERNTRALANAVAETRRELLGVGHGRRLRAPAVGRRRAARPPRVLT